MAADAMYIEDQAFVTALDCKITFEGVAAMGTHKKLMKEKLISRLDNITHHFNKNGIAVTWLHLDNEFRPMKKNWKSAGSQKLISVLRTNLSETLSASIERLRIASG